MFFYPDFILPLILYCLFPDFILILSGIYPEKTTLSKVYRIFSRFFQNIIFSKCYPNFIQILSDLDKKTWTALKRMTFDFLTTSVALSTKYFFMLFFSLLFENAPYDFYGLFFITVWKCPDYSLEKCKGLK